MPSIRIHEKIGYEIGKKFNLSSYDYYLGLMAPDAVNLEGFASKEERWTSHRRKENRVEWRQELKKFYEEVKNIYPKEFLIGYCIHILTDIVYDDFFYLPVRDIIEKTTTREHSHEVMRKDMDYYSFREWENIRNILKQEKTSYDILNIKKDTLSKWKNKQLEYEVLENKSTYITEEVLRKLEQKVLEEIIK